MATKETVAANAQLTEAVRKAQNRKHELAQLYAKQEKVAVSGSPFYRPYFGNNMPIQINGIAVYVPLDGQQHLVPKTFADEFQRRIAKVDMLQMKQKAMDANTFEEYAGETDLLLSDAQIATDSE